MSLPVVLRRGDDRDGPAVQRCVYLALSWAPDRSLPPMHEVLSHPDVAVYHAGWGRPGDVVIVAEMGDERIGSSFARRFSEGEHGHGFVDESIPEIGAAVEPGQRGCGVGTELLRRLHVELQAAGIEHASLSVELANPARRLYGRLGYAEVDRRDGAAIMVVEL